ncbi:MAG: DNA-directed polymerase, beta subunit, predominant form, partial [Conexibacter sp.]|nr:DNA-directed polymerase, beta subunit, predominant form [Conexibacter sp.]
GVETGVYSTPNELFLAFSQKKVGVHARIKMRLPAHKKLKGEGEKEFTPGMVVTTTTGRVIFNDILHPKMPFYNMALGQKQLQGIIADCYQILGRRETINLLDAMKDLGFRESTRSGLSFATDDLKTPSTKEQILGETEKEVGKAAKLYHRGIITEQERYNKVLDAWTHARERITTEMMDQLKNDVRNGQVYLNPIFLMAESGARGGVEQIRQLAGMRGLMAKPSGKIIETPIKANFREGLSVLEYFSSTHGARKGLADTALKTADSGYLTRKLADVAQNVVITQEDCGTSQGITKGVIYKGEKVEVSLTQSIRGRVSRVNIVNPITDDVVVKENEMITIASARKLEEMNIEKIQVRSPMTCEASLGICRRCYGMDLSTGQLVEPGMAVGIIAAQSIGEPGTQLTMRTFHTGGVAGADITHGLPRVVELFEARRPKGLARIAEVGGVVEIEETDKALTVVITDDGGDEHRHTFPRRTRLFVERGEKIEPGKQLNEGSVYPHELLAIRGRTETELYLVKEVQEVYKSQGVDINDKHIELIVRQMLKKVRVDQKGDTDLLPGVFVDRFDYANINQAVIDQGGEPAQAEEIILGITKASLNTDSFLSAASFQETTKVLTDAALEGKIDRLNGLKENVIIGKLIPAATGLRRYRRIEIEPAEPLPRGMDDVGLLDHDELAAELGLTDGEALQGFGPGIEADLADLEEIGNGGGSQGFAEELAELDVPDEGRGS